VKAETWVIGSGPNEETLAVVGDADFSGQNLRECVVFKKQLEREFGEAPARSDLIIKSELHDFGIFWTVAIRFDPEDPDAVAFADCVEDGAARWDQMALQELGR
jgi:hypothetical protein